MCVWETHVLFYKYTWYLYKYSYCWWTCDKYKHMNVYFWNTQMCRCIYIFAYTYFVWMRLENHAQRDGSKQMSRLEFYPNSSQTWRVDTQVSCHQSFSCATHVPLFWQQQHFRTKQSRNKVIYLCCVLKIITDLIKMVLFFQPNKKKKKNYLVHLFSDLQ